MDEFDRYRAAMYEKLHLRRAIERVDQLLEKSE
jgi:hypothetical protein